MKIKLCFLVLLLIPVILPAQQTSAPAVQLAEKIALKMKDSLGLSSAQQASIYQINVQLHERKLTARQQQSEPTAVQLALQQIENSRDSLYKPVLGEEKYLLYRQKKRNLVSNN